MIETNGSTQLRFAYNTITIQANGEILKTTVSVFPLPGTPAKDKIYLSSPEVDNARLQRGHADTGHNIQYTGAQPTLTHPLAVL